MDAKAQARFWSNVQAGEGCWNWKLSKDRDGYGHFKYNGKTRSAHRIAYELSVGPIPEGMQVDHTCHRPACCNPRHLRAATPKQNSENMAGAYRNNKSGHLGVSYVRKTGKWMVRVSHLGEYHYGGTHATPELAATAATALRNSLFTHNDKDRIAAALRKLSA